MRRFLFLRNSSLHARGIFSITLINLQRAKYPYEKLAHLSLGPSPANRAYKSHVAHVKAYEQNLAYHLRCNVLLFFYILVLYHAKKRMVSIATTDIQFGKGSKKRKEEAAHSTIIPALRDCAPTKKSITNFQESLLQKTPFFYHDNNMTVCLPMIVNRQIDCRIEKEIRAKAVAIINFVSFRKLCPIKAMNIYLAVLRQAMRKLERELQKQPKTDAVQAQLLALKNQRKGLVGINEHLINQLMGKGEKESSKAALKRVQFELLTGDAYRKRMMSVLNRPDSLFVTKRKRARVCRKKSPLISQQKADRHL